MTSLLTIAGVGLGAGLSHKLHELSSNMPEGISNVIVDTVLHASVDHFLSGFEGETVSGIKMGLIVSNFFQSSLEGASASQDDDTFVRRMIVGLSAGSIAYAFPHKLFTNVLYSSAVSYFFSRYVSFNRRAASN